MEFQKRHKLRACCSFDSDYFELVYDENPELLSENMGNIIDNILSKEENPNEVESVFFE